MNLEAVIFDLDGVLTDTAEYHFLAWKRLAEEEGLPFSRADNERLRGVSRRQSLLLILDGRSLPEEKMQEMMARKNRYYRQMLAQLTPDDLLPGGIDLLDQLDKTGIPYAVASASRNAAEVVARLGIGERLAALVDGHSVMRQKPAADLFRCAAVRLNLPPAQCLVVEDAAAGIEAALAAGMAALALGPAERFGELLLRNGRLAQRHTLQDVQLADLQAISCLDEKWVVVEESFDPARQHHMETVFTLGNGYFSTRGSLEEGYPGDRPLTLAHGIYDNMPVAFTELANLPAWLDLAIGVDGTPFRLDAGEILYFYRYLDVRRGVLRREVRWRSPEGTELDLSFERFASYASEHVGAWRVLVTAVNRACHITIESGINGHVANEDLLHWHLLQQDQDKEAIWLHSRTRHTNIELATAALLKTPVATPLSCYQCPGQPRLSLNHHLAAGQTLQVDKLMAYAASRDAAAAAERVVARALAYLQEFATYDEFKAAHVTAWLQRWQDCDVVIEGDKEAQIAMRFSLFQLLVAAPQHDERVSIGAKTLSGLGYRGHVFWDTEIFVLPFFIYTYPQAARNMLMYRYHTLPGARRKAQANGFGGAQYAWESASTGDEVSPTWVPDFEGKGLVRIWTGDIQLHISADIAYAIYRYWQVTGDDLFMRDYGAEMILETARFWGERAEREEGEGGQYRYAIRDVIGPDEYHDHVDNNVFTNRMVQWHLQTAVSVLDWLRATYPQQATALEAQIDLTAERLAHWQDVAGHLIIYHDRESGLMTQFEGFFNLQDVDWPAFAGRTKSMQVLLGIEGANKSQVLKQADVLMLLCLLREHYSTKTWQINWDVYVPITDHAYGSSVSPSFHAWAACELGQPDEAYRYFMLAARADLHDVRGNAGDGIHAASAGGLWQAAVFGFAGLHITKKGLQVRPKLPVPWRRVAFTAYYRGQPYRIDIRSATQFDVTALD